MKSLASDIFEISRSIVSEPVACFNACCGVDQSVSHGCSTIDLHRCLYSLNNTGYKNPSTHLSRSRCSWCHHQVPSPDAFQSLQELTLAEVFPVVPGLPVLRPCLHSILSTSHHVQQDTFRGLRPPFQSFDPRHPLATIISSSSFSFQPPQHEMISSCSSSPSSPRSRHSSSRLSS